MKNSKWLTVNQHWLLCEALRRYKRFHEHEARPLIEAWTGLGSMTTYKPCLNAGFMTYATTPNPGYSIWWRLTDKGAAIVQQWINEGFSYNDIETNRLPSLIILKHEKERRDKL